MEEKPGDSLSNKLSLEDEDSLDWAKKAYEKLKLEQEAKKKETLIKQEKDDINTVINISKEQVEQPSQLISKEIKDISNPLLEEKKVDSLSEKSQEETVLGDFNETFTWSAKVLEAQGKKAENISLDEINWLSKLQQGLEKTRKGFVTDLLEKFGDDPLTPDDLEELETLLLRSDVGVNATDQIIDALRTRLNEEVLDSKEGLRFLKEQLCKIVDGPINDSCKKTLLPERGVLNIWLLVGVNGVGKTTTLGKLAHLSLTGNFSTLIAAADTFRAAAVEQVKVWGARSGISVIANESPNADPAAVVFDAIGAAHSKKVELLLVDTAGRLQTKNNLMEELTKVRKVIDRLAPNANVESLLVLDSSQGQNGLSQAMAFAKSAKLTGVVITKLDGSSKGGVAFAVASQAQLPIRFIGVGEGIKDLRPFNSFEFVEALLAKR